MRNGHKMLLTAEIAKIPTSRIDLARDVGPKGSLRYGYAIVNRALRAGILVAAPTPEGRRGLFVVAV